MLRIVLGIIVGIVVATVVFMAFQAVNAIFFPLPEGVDFSDQEGMKKFIETMPPTGFIVVLIGYAVGSLCAAFSAKTVAQDSSIATPIVLGAFFSLGWVMNITALPHPVWVVIVGFFMFLPFAFLGYKLASK